MTFEEILTRVESLLREDQDVYGDLEYFLADEGVQQKDVSRLEDSRWGAYWLYVYQFGNDWFGIRVHYNAGDEVGDPEPSLYVIEPYEVTVTKYNLVTEVAYCG